MKYHSNKQTLRIKALERRLTLSDVEVEQLSKDISKIFFREFDFEHLNIACFASIASKREVLTLPLIEVLYRENHVYLPVSDFINFNMDHYPYQPGDFLLENKYGIPEPVQREIHLEARYFDVAIIPIVEVDLSGNRIGYGKGFYDRFLSQCRTNTLKIGLHFFDPIEEIPKEKNDVSLDYLVTPKNCYDFKKINHPG
ncbi:MAG: 5-formyltetrahydrofolate cyclo-ligase [Bacteroidota bacterium]